jgi:hypothetical protein
MWRNSVIGKSAFGVSDKALEFSKFLLPQRGQKCIASPFAEDSFDGVADPVMTSSPAVAHVERPQSLPSG